LQVFRKAEYHSSMEMDFHRVEKPVRILTEHVHGSGCQHHHSVTDLSQINRAFFYSIGLNALFVVVEVIYGTIANSMALLADAGHNLQDVLALSLSAFSLWLAHKPKNDRWTFGYRKGTILASLANASLLMLGAGGIIWECARRIAAHAGHGSAEFNFSDTINSHLMISVSLAGVVINLSSAFLFRGKKELNARGAYLHLMMDAAISVAVAASGFLILKTGAIWVDQVMSLLIAALIIFGGWSVLRDSFWLSLNRVPSSIDVNLVRKKIYEMAEVSSVSNLCVWPISTTENAMTAHVLVTEASETTLITRQLSALLRNEFPVHHLTLQVEAQSARSLDC
jgi:cobalt-zinc-cadmium efflux system protein